jgi:hypothetical protein
VRTEDGRSREAVTVRNPGTRGARTRERPRAKWSRSGRPGVIPRVQTYPRRERGEPGCSRTPHGRSEDRVTNNSADTSVAGAMVLALWFARAPPPHRIPLRSGREWLRGKDVCQRSGPCEVGRAEDGQRPPSRIKADGSDVRTRIAAKRRSRCSNNRGYSGRRDQRYTFLPRPIRSSTWHPV